MTPKNALWGAILSAGPILVGCVLMFLGFAIRTYPVPYLLTALLLYGLGFCLFLKAKLSLIAAGQFVTFGPGKLDAPNKHLYLVGYALMGMAAILTLVLWIHFRT